jgi:hypothetical protein
MYQYLYFEAMNENYFQFPQRLIYTFSSYRVGWKVGGEMQQNPNVQPTDKTQLPN